MKTILKVLQNKVRRTQSMTDNAVSASRERYLSKANRNGYFLVSEGTSFDDKYQVTKLILEKNTLEETLDLIITAKQAEQRTYDFVVAMCEKYGFEMGSFDNSKISLEDALSCHVLLTSERESRNKAVFFKHFYNL